MRLPALLAVALVAAAGTAQAADSTQTWKDMAKQQANTKIAEKLNLPTAAPADAKVYFIAPADGATVTSPVKVQFGLTGMGIAPAGMQFENTGHHHLLIDAPTVDFTVPLPTTEQIVHFGKGQTETAVTLKPGTHKLQLVFGDWKHQPFAPALQSETITVTVK
ncbi:MAG TPA: DUF4399 domain-containing protein [Nevskiaceae bacterium]|nr:DUF4399 domain-containing protein [Nevskiaceae bacterium]